MAHHFSIEVSPTGLLRVAVIGDDGTQIMTSTPIGDRERAREAIAALRRVLARDWCYRILNPRRAGPCFTIDLPVSGIRYTSRIFSSCDAMEREIARLKTAASTSELHSYDISPEREICRQGDEAPIIAARLRALA